MIAVPGFEGRRVAVFGLGRSGLSAARALRAGGAEPVLWDDTARGREEAAREGFVLEDLAVADWRGFAALVLSPGVPLSHPAPHWTVGKARAAGLPVIGDIELFARAMAACPPDRRPKVIAVTGTNGKSTTTALLGWVLKQPGATVHVGGNIGVGVLSLPGPEADRAPSPPVYVVETSSYQLDLTESFRPDVAILTNITPDHLDRHGGMAGYVVAKNRLFSAQGEGDTAVIGVDDDWGVRIADRLDGKVETLVRVSAAHPTSGVYALDGKLWDCVGGTPVEVCDLTRARSLPGRHNAQNAACAYAAARAVGLSREAAAAGLMSFPGLAHRMEEVGRLGQVRFVNDSKATNADAARQALASYPRSWWIAGGRAKDEGIAPLADLFDRVAHAYLIGEAADDFARVLDGHAPWTVSEVMEAAVADAAADAAAAGEPAVVLLSPACASFDQFPDFEVRGEAFRAAVLALGAIPPEDGA